MRIATVLLAIASMIAARPAAGKEPPRIKAALLPLEAINLSADEQARYQDLLARGVRAIPGVLLDERPVKAAAGCAAEVSCLRDLGALLGADKLLALRAGRLGDTTVVRLTVFDVPRGVRLGTWQEVLRRSDDAAVSAALDRMLAGIAPRPAPGPAWYTRWWVWVAASAVVAGSVTAAVLATRPRDAPDWTITPN